MLCIEDSFEFCVLGFGFCVCQGSLGLGLKTQNAKRKTQNFKPHSVTYSCKDFTASPLVWIERMALMLASTPLTVVRIGIRRATAKLRIFTSSSLGVLPLGVLIIRWISSFLIMSMTCGRPSLNLKSRFTCRPADASAAAVPLVA